MKNLKLSITHWIIVTLSILVGLLLLLLGVQNRKLKLARLSLLEKDLDLTIIRNEQKIKEKKKKLAREKRK